jgi:putative transposase
MSHPDLRYLLFSLNATGATHMAKYMKFENTYQDTLINQPDLLRSPLQTIIQEAVNARFEEFMGAGRYQRAEGRKGYRNGSYEREYATLKVGTIELVIPRDRDGNFDHDVFEQYSRSDKAVAHCIIEMFVKGVSTRKLAQAFKRMFGISVSKSHASDIASKIDADIQDWRMRPLPTPYAYLMIDARYEKVRENGHVISKAFVIVIGITAQGFRDVIGTWVINSESFEAWNTCIAELKERGLHGVEYVVSDENAGLRAALAKHFQGARLQRCQVHFMRNLIGKVAKGEQQEVIKLLQDVFAALTKEAALERTKILVEYLVIRKKSEVADWVENAIEDTLAVYSLPEEHRVKMRSTNMLERLNGELKRRSRVIRIFPNAASCLRIMTAVTIELSEEWGERRYLSV